MITMDDSKVSEGVVGYVVPATPVKPKQSLKFYVRRKESQNTVLHRIEESNAKDDLEEMRSKLGIPQDLLRIEESNAKDDLEEMRSKLEIPQEEKNSKEEPEEMHSKLQIPQVGDKCLFPGDCGFVMSDESKSPQGADKKKVGDNCLFPGDCGFGMSNESKSPQGIHGKEEKISKEKPKEKCDTSHIPKGAKNSQSRKGNKKMPNVRPRLPKFHRPRIMEEGKKPRNPATTRMRTLSKKRKKDKDSDEEFVYEPRTPEKQSFQKRSKKKKTKSNESLPKERKAENTKSNVARSLFVSQDVNSCCLKLTKNFGPSFLTTRKRKTRRARSDFYCLLVPLLDMPIWKTKNKRSERKKSMAKQVRIASSWRLLEELFSLFTSPQKENGISSHEDVSFDIEDTILKSDSDVAPKLDMLRPRLKKETTEIVKTLLQDASHQFQSDLPSIGIVDLQICPLQTQGTIVESFGPADLKLQKKRMKDNAAHLIQQISYQNAHNLSSLADVPLHMEDTLIDSSHLDVLPKRATKSITDFSKLVKELKRLNINRGNRRITTLAKRKEKLITAKVDLDSETIKEWELLMVNDLPSRSYSDEETESKWKKRREIFQSQINIFIDRMHRLQGNRKFQQWKGSVVDSVIGVFLTQNVSDYLSSNAFISVAAKFPIEMEKTDGFKSLEYSIDEPFELDEINDDAENSEVEEHENVSQRKNPKTGIMEDETIDWKSIRRTYTKEETRDKMYMDSVDWNAARLSGAKVFASIIIKRGQHNELARKIVKFLNKEIEENEVVDLEWLRDAPSDLVKRYLLEIEGIGLKSTECVRLLGLKHSAFPVDTNVCRISVRLGWVPLEPLPNDLKMHDLFYYPSPDLVQKYLWPRLSQLSQETLYELHYQLITFGKVFCTKVLPNCNACPMKSECKYFASAYVSKNLLRGPEEKPHESTTSTPAYAPDVDVNMTPVIEEFASSEYTYQTDSRKFVQFPRSSIAEISEILDIEDLCQPKVEIGELPEIGIDMNALKRNVEDALTKSGKTMNNCDEELLKALVVLTPKSACIPLEVTKSKLKYYNRLRTEHVVYVLPDNHELLNNFGKRETGDPTPYLLAIWQPGETYESSTPPKKECNFDGSNLCEIMTCSFCRSIYEQRSNEYRGTILIPCRTAMRGAFPLNGTYFQTNEVFADHDTSIKPLVFRRELCNGLEKRALYCGTSVSAIFRFLETSRIQLCFWIGFLCMRGFHRRSRYPRVLVKRLHCPPNK